jgi:hypothetical protein
VNGPGPHTPASVRYTPLLSPAPPRSGHGIPSSAKPASRDPVRESKPTSQSGSAVKWNVASGKWMRPALLAGAFGDVLRVPSIHPQEEPSQRDSHGCPPTPHLRMPHFPGRNRRSDRPRQPHAWRPALTSATSTALRQRPCRSGGSMAAPNILGSAEVTRQKAQDPPSARLRLMPKHPSRRTSGRCTPSGGIGRSSRCQAINTQPARGLAHVSRGLRVRHAPWPGRPGQARTCLGVACRRAGGAGTAPSSDWQATTFARHSARAGRAASRIERGTVSRIERGTVSRIERGLRGSRPLGGSAPHLQFPFVVAII